MVWNGVKLIHDVISQYTRDEAIRLAYNISGCNLK